MSRYLVDVMVTLEVEADDETGIDAAVEHELDIHSPLTLRNWDTLDWSIA